MVFLLMVNSEYEILGRIAMYCGGAEWDDTDAVHQTASFSELCSIVQSVKMTLSIQSMQRIVARYL